MVKEMGLGSQAGLALIDTLYQKAKARARGPLDLEDFFDLLEALGAAAFPPASFPDVTPHDVLARLLRMASGDAGAAEVSGGGGGGVRGASTRNASPLAPSARHASRPAHPPSREESRQAASAAAESSRNGSSGGAPGGGGAEDGERVLSEKKQLAVAALLRGMAAGERMQQQLPPPHPIPATCPRKTSKGRTSRAAPAGRREKGGGEASEWVPVGDGARVPSSKTSVRPLADEPG
jgi:hypothetical protein